MSTQCPVVEEDVPTHTGAKAQGPAHKAIERIGNRFPPTPPVSPDSGPTDPNLPTLPQGWIAQWDNTSRKYYYVQITTGVSQWELPTEETPIVASGEQQSTSSEDSASGSPGGRKNLVGRLAGSLLGGGKQSQASEGFGENNDQVSSLRDLGGKKQSYTGVGEYGYSVKGNFCRSIGPTNDFSEIFDSLQRNGTLIGKIYGNDPQKTANNPCTTSKSFDEAIDDSRRSTHNVQPSSPSQVITLAIRPVEDQASRAVQPPKSPESQSAANTTTYETCGDSSEWHCSSTDTKQQNEEASRSTLPTKKHSRNGGEERQPKTQEVGTKISTPQISPSEVGGQARSETETSDLGVDARSSMPLVVGKMLESITSRLKCLVLQQLMNDARSETTDVSDHNASQKSGSQSSISTSASREGSEQLRGRKRTLHGRNAGRLPSDNGNGSDEEEEGERPLKRNGRFPEHETPYRRLKCPFYQRDPEKHVRAACRGEGFVDMAKLKDHIKRVHTQPLRCSRCWKDMKSAETYAAHLREDTICKKAPEPVDDRIHHHVLHRLNFKKAPFGHGQNTEQKWKILFSTLFPNDKDIPSPYDRHGISPRLEVVLYEALEAELSRELAPALEPIIRRMQERIPTIIDNCKARLREAVSDSKENSDLSDSVEPEHNVSPEERPSNTMRPFPKRGAEKEEPTRSSSSGSSSYAAFGSPHDLSGDDSSNSEAHIWPEGAERDLSTHKPVQISKPFAQQPLLDELLMVDVDLQHNDPCLSLGDTFLLESQIPEMSGDYDLLSLSNSSVYLEMSDFNQFYPSLSRVVDDQ